MRDAETEPGHPAGNATGLRMPRETMLKLAQQCAELLVDWNTQLAAKDAWEGDFSRILADEIPADPPERGRPATDVVEHVARKILPTAARHQHPRFFGFVTSSVTWPGVLAEFLAAGYNINACTWLAASGPSQVELVVVDWFRRWLGYPEGAGGRRAGGGSGIGRESRNRVRLHERPDP